MKKFFILIVLIAFLFLYASCTPPSLEQTTPSEAAKENTAELPEPTPSATISETATPNPTPKSTPEPTEALTVFGDVKNGVYVNELLGLTAKFPDGWTAATEPQMLEMHNLTKERALHYDFDSIFSLINMIIIMQAEKDNSGSEEQGFLINFTVKNTEWTPEYKDAALQSVVSMMGQLDKAIGSSTEINAQEDVAFGATPYNHINIITDMNDITQYQEQFFTSVKDYVLVITFSYTDKYNGETGIIPNFLESIKFE